MVGGVSLSINAADFTSRKVQGIMVTGVKNKCVVSWEKVTGATGYKVYQINSKGEYILVATTKKLYYVHSNLTRGTTYSYKVRAYHQQKRKITYSKYSKIGMGTVAQKGITTLKTFLDTALAPCGSTMYIWGGGWDVTDTKAGDDALRIGLNGQWRTFYKKQSSSYDYNKYRYDWGNGLDCSGYIGWVMYNILNTKPNKDGYVKLASKQGEWFAQKGYGTFKKSSQVTEYKPGDIMSSSGHIYICLGSLSDGSVLLVHASPPGISVCGTVTPSGGKNSKAILYAKKLRKKEYGQWNKKYSDCIKPVSYLTDYDQFRFDLTGESIMTDPDKIAQKEVYKK